MTLRPCLTCGLPSAGPRCDDHRADHKPSAHTRGYDAAWTRLSAKARRLQPWCSDCGSVEDLQADHTPEAWERKAAGKPIRLQDVDVTCGPCNRARGAARPQQTSARPQQTSGRGQQTPLTPPTRGHAPPTPSSRPLPQAKSALHTAAARIPLWPANSKLGAANSKLGAAKAVAS